MKIRNVKIKLMKDLSFEDGYRVKAIADVYIKDGFRVRNIKILQQRDNSLSLNFALPMFNHSTFEPWTPEAKRMIETIVIGAYWKKIHNK